MNKVGTKIAVLILSLLVIGSVAFADGGVRTYKSDFYSTKYTTQRVRDVHRSPAMPTENDKQLTVTEPINPYCPIDGHHYTNAELSNISHFVLKKGAAPDKFDEYAVSKDGTETLIGKDGIIMCIADEGFVYFAGGKSGTFYGTFFFTNYGYDKLIANNDSLTYYFKYLNLTHDNVNKITD